MYFKLKVVFYLLKTHFLLWLFSRNLRALRQWRLWVLLRFLKRKSAFYAPFLQKKRVLSGLPKIEKTAFMQHFDQINTRNIRLSHALEVAERAERSRDFLPTISGVAVGLSTGTSGNRGVFLASSTERAMWVAAVLHRVVGWQWRRRSVAFFLRANNQLYQATESRLLKFEFFDIFLDINAHIARLNNLKPTILVAQPSMLCLLAQKKMEGSLEIFPEKVISVAEVLTPEDKNYLQNCFGQTIHQVYQCTEGFLAATCVHGTLHFNEDFLMVEKKYLNDEKTKFYPIITDLLRTTQPVVRYELNDILTEKTTPCPCGNPMLAIESIEGRADDVLGFYEVGGKFIKFFPDIFRKIIVLSSHEIQDYALVQTDFGVLELYIKTENERAYLAAKAALLLFFAEKNIENLDIIKLHTDPLIAGQKKRRIRNETN